MGCGEEEGWARCTSCSEELTSHSLCTLHFGGVGVIRRREGLTDERIGFLKFSLSRSLNSPSLSPLNSFTYPHMNHLNMLKTSIARQTLRNSTRSLHSTRLVLSKKDTPLTHPSLVSDPPVANPSTASDPWPLKPPPLPPAPTLPPHIKTMDDLLSMPHPEGRDNEPTEILRKRLVYESRKRGILEMDLILSTFAQSRLSQLNDRQLREYDRVRFFFFFPH